MKRNIKTTLTYFGAITSKKNSKQSSAKAQEENMAWEFGIDITEELSKAGIALSDWKYSPHKMKVEIWNKDARRHDLDNQLSSIQDALVLAGILPDDDAKYLPEIHVFYRGIDAKEPRAVVTLTTEVEL